MGIKKVSWCITCNKPLEYGHPIGHDIDVRIVKRIKNKTGQWIYNPTPKITLTITERNFDIGATI